MSIWLSALRRTLRLAKRWGVHATIGTEIISLLATVVFGTGSLLKALLHGLLSVAILVVLVFLGNLICEPHIRLSRRVDRLARQEGRKPTAVDELAQSYLDLLSTVRKSVGSSRADTSRQAILDKEEKLMFLINEVAAVSNKPTKWFYGDGAGDFSSVHSTIRHIVARDRFHMYRGDDKLLRNKLFELQAICHEIKRGEGR